MSLYIDISAPAANNIDSVIHSAGLLLSPVLGVLFSGGPSFHLGGIHPLLGGYSAVPAGTNIGGCVGIITNGGVVGAAV